MVNNSKTGKNAVIYARTATMDQAKCGYSIDCQIAECKKLAVDNGCTVTEVFVDAGESGSNLERPAYKEMTEYCENNDIDVVIVWKLDRLTRNLRDYYTKIVPFLEKHGIKLLSATSNMNDINFLLSYKISLFKTRKKKSKYFVVSPNLYVCMISLPLTNHCTEYPPPVMSSASNTA